MSKFKVGDRVKLHNSNGRQYGWAEGLVGIYEVKEVQPLAAATGGYRYRATGYDGLLYVKEMAVS